MCCRCFVFFVFFTQLCLPCHSSVEQLSIQRRGDVGCFGLRAGAEAEQVIDSLSVKFFS